MIPGDVSLLNAKIVVMSPPDTISGVFENQLKDVAIDVCSNYELQGHAADFKNFYASSKSLSDIKRIGKMKDK